MMLTKEEKFISAFCSKPKGTCSPFFSPLKYPVAELLTVLSSSLSNFMSAVLQAYLADYENKLLRKRCFVWLEARMCTANTRHVGRKLILSALQLPRRNVLKTESLKKLETEIESLVFF